MKSSLISRLVPKDYPLPDKRQEFPIIFLIFEQFHGRKDRGLDLKVFEAFQKNEGSEECHIHVESGENYAKFWLEPIDLAKSVGYNNKELSEIREIIQHNVKHFKEMWDAYFGFKRT